MVPLLLAVLCSLAIGMIFKYAGRHKMDRTALLTVNYAAAVGVAGILIALGGRGVQGGLAAEPGLLMLGLGTGALLIFGFYVLAVATDVAGMGLAIGVMRVSVVIPFLMSWIIWNEVPSVAQNIGMGLAGLAFFMIAWRREQAPEPSTEFATAAAAATSPGAGPETVRELTHEAQAVLQEANVSWRAFGVLAVLFLSGGAVDVTMKAFQETFGATSSRVLFLLLSFGVAFLIGLVIVLWRGIRRGQWPKQATVGWGVVLGVINYGSLEFILRAIRQLPGTVVFPVNNIAIVILAAVLGVTIWGERLSRLNQAGLGLAALALLLLNL